MCKRERVCPCSVVGEWTGPRRRRSGNQSEFTGVDYRPQSVGNRGGVSRLRWGCGYQEYALASNLSEPLKTRAGPVLRLTQPVPPTPRSGPRGSTQSTSLGSRRRRHRKTPGTHLVVFHFTPLPTPLKEDPFPNVRPANSEDPRSIQLTGEGFERVFRIFDDNLINRK